MNAPRALALNPTDTALLLAEAYALDPELRAARRKDPKKNLTAMERRKWMLLYDEFERAFREEVRYALEQDPTLDRWRLADGLEDALAEARTKTWPMHFSICIFRIAQLRIPYKEGGNDV